MKIAEYQQMMDYLTGPRERFNGGGSVRNKTILPKKKPEEEVKKRKIKNFQKLRSVLENPEEVKKMIDKPKRGLVDEPGSYAGDPKVAAKNIAAWKKANPNLNFDDLLSSQKSRIRTGKKDGKPINILKVGTGEVGAKEIITPEREANKAKWIKANPQKSFENLAASDQLKVKRTGDITIGTRGLSRIDQGIYTIDELAKVEGMPFSKETLRYLTGAGKRKDKYFNKNAKKFLKAFKEAGIERLPKRNVNDSFRFKMLNSTKSIEKIVDFALTLDKAPKELVKPYEKEILTQYNKLIKSGKPFSKEMLKEEVFKNVPEKTFKIADPTFDNVYKRILTETQRNKIIDNRKLKQLPRKTIIDNLLDGKSNIKQLAKASNLSTKEVGNEIQAIFREIYRSREQAGAKQKVTNLILKDYSTRDYQKILEVINKEPTLDSFFKASYRDLLFNAIGNPDNPDTYQPKKYARAIERLKAYESVNKKLLEQFGIKLSLDHSLSRGAIKTIENAEPSQFLRVNPIPENINAGIKKSFDIRYQNVIKDLQSGQFRGEELKNLLIQKAELEKLSKDIDLPFGKMSPTGKIIKYDAVDFLNKNLPSEIKAGVSLPNRIRQAVDKMNPTVLKERFKVAFGDRADDVLEVLNKIKKQDNLQDIYKFLKPLLKVKGFRVDASDFLNKISDTIVSPVAAAEVLPGEAQAATPKEPMNFDLDMSSPKPSEPLKYLPDYKDAALFGAGTAAASKFMKADPLKKFRRFITAAPVRKALGKVVQGAGTPLAGPLFAATNIYSKMKEGQSFTDAVVDPLTGIELALPGLFKQSVSKITKNPALQQALRLGRFGRMLTPIGLTLAAAGQGQEFYNQYKDLQKMKEQNPRAYSEFMSRRVAPALSDAEQTAIEDEGRFGAAGGGIMKLAGKSSGPAPESGPTPQGLDFLIKRGR
jgi:hypothetical protein